MLVQAMLYTILYVLNQYSLSYIFCVCGSVWFYFYILGSCLSLPQHLFAQSDESWNKLDRQQRKQGVVVGIISAL